MTADTRSGPARWWHGVRGYFYARMRRPVAFYLVLLLLISIVPAFVFTGVVLSRTYEAQSRVVASLLQASTSSVNRIVEREIVSMVTTLRVMSTFEALEDGDFAAFHARATKALKGTDSYLILSDQTYHQWLNTRVAYGTDLQKMADPASVDLAFRAKGPTVSNIIFGNTAKRWVYNVYLPVTTLTGSRYLLTLTQNAESMNKAVTREALSANWSAALIDGAGKVIVSTDSTDAMGKPLFLGDLPDVSDGTRTVEKDGVSYSVVTDFSVITGWKIVSWAKTSDTNADQINSFLWLSAGGAVFVAFGITAAVAVARLLSDGVTMIARDAHRLGRGEEISARRHMVSEVEIVSAALSKASAERTKSENEIRFLMREVAHRSKNQLSVIQGMLNQSANSAPNQPDFVDAFRKRITGLAHSTDLMIDNAAQGVELHQLAENQLKPFMPQDNRRRVNISGPTLRVDAQAAQMIGMALHELSTNAAKYGAFANNRGTVAFVWSLVDGDRIHMVWRERGADLAEQNGAAPRKGFGSAVLERMLVMALGAELTRHMHADGIEWQITIPHDRLTGGLAPDA